MKKIILVAALSIMIVSVFAQVPQAINYQAVVRNNAGQPVASQNISIKISILDASATLLVPL